MRVPMRVPGWELTEIVFSIGEMDELVEQMKLMNVLMNLQIKEVNERMERFSIYGKPGASQKILEFLKKNNNKLLKKKGFYDVI